MLENYEVLLDGRIHQIKANPFKYDYSYSNNYNSEQYLLNSQYISYLRYGFISGAIGQTFTSVLDVGYGNGEFLKVCKNNISECYGYDVSDYPVPEGCIKVDSLLDTHYDLITFFDSLEHFPDLDFVKNLDCNFICVSVPWCHNFNDEWFEVWKHRKPDEHLWHFDLYSLTNFMKNSGYSLVCYGNIEDIIRKSVSNDPNILTAMFKR